MVVAESSNSLPYPNLNNDYYTVLLSREDIDPFCWGPSRTQNPTDLQTPTNKSTWIAKADGTLMPANDHNVNPVQNQLSWMKQRSRSSFISKNQNYPINPKHSSVKTLYRSGFGSVEWSRRDWISAPKAVNSVFSHTEFFVSCGYVVRNKLRKN